VSLLSCESDPPSNWSISGMSFLQKLWFKFTLENTALISKYHRAPVGYRLYITDDLYTFYLIFVRNNMQLRPSYKVNIHNGIVVLIKSYYPNADGLSQITLSKFNIYGYSLFRKSIMIS
jgi:hypothetical protein